MNTRKRRALRQQRRRVSIDALVYLFGEGSAGVWREGVPLLRCTMCPRPIPRCVAEVAAALVTALRLGGPGACRKLARSILDAVVLPAPVQPRAHHCLNVDTIAWYCRSCARRERQRYRLYEYSEAVRALSRRATRRVRRRAELKVVRFAATYGRTGATLAAQLAAPAV